MASMRIVLKFHLHVFGDNKCIFFLHNTFQLRHGMKIPQFATNTS